MRVMRVSIEDDVIVAVDGAPVAWEQATTAVGDDATTAATDAKDEDTVSPDTPLEVVVAAVCHEAIRQYCRSVGDPVPPRWSDATGDARASTLEAVRRIENGTIKTPMDAHAHWMAEKLDQGWTYGPERSFAKKQHPSLVAYAQLPRHERMKDRVLFAIATTLLAPE